MIRAIFKLFRHGRAEADISRHDPFILIKTFGPGLIEGDDQELTRHGQSLRILWAASATVGANSALQMRWVTEADRVRNAS